MKTKEDVEKFVEENRDLFNKLNDDFMKGFFSPVSEMYFDLPVLKDIRLGLMISLADETNMKLIKDNIDKYNIRPNRSFTYAFKGFKYSEKELQKMYLDEKYHTQMFNYAVDTDLSVLLGSLFKLSRDQNIRAEYNGNINVTVNTYPISSENELIKQYGKILNDYFKGVDFNLISTNPKRLSEKFWTKQNIIVMDDLITMTAADCGLFKPWLDEQIMSAVKIFAPYQVMDSVLEKWKKEERDLSNKQTLAELFAPTELTLKLISNFKFIPNQIPTR